MSVYKWSRNTNWKNVVPQNKDDSSGSGSSCYDEERDTELPKWILQIHQKTVLNNTIHILRRALYF